MLQNAYLVAKIGADTAENEQHFAEILPRIGNYPTGQLPMAAIVAPSARPGTRVPVRSFFCILTSLLRAPSSHGCFTNLASGLRVVCELLGITFKQTMLGKCKEFRKSRKS